MILRSEGAIDLSAEGADNEFFWNEMIALGADGDCSFFHFIPPVFIFDGVTRHILGIFFWIF